MTTKAVVVVNSLVARGRVGARAQAFALERLGLEPWLVPTVMLPFHPGHGPGRRVETSPEDFAGLVDALIGRGLEGVGAVLTGYLGNPGQLPHLLRLVAAAREHNPDVLVCCDPVIGDARGLYVAEDLALAILEQLVPAADVLTPNRFELAWLTGHPVSSNTEIIKAVSALQPPTVLTTSAHAMMRGNMANLLVHETRAWLAEARAIDNPPHGTGDLTSAVFAALSLRGERPDATLSRTTSCVHDVLAVTGPGAEEMALVAGQDRLVSPRMPVSLRTLATVP